MSRKTATSKISIIAIVLTIGFQLLVLVGMYVNAALPLWTGKEVRVKTVPVDPRSLFRGNYARLNYAFSVLDGDLFPGDKSIRTDEIVYVSLKQPGVEKQGKNGLYEYDSVSLEKPDSGVFLRGRIQNRGARYHIKYGIEAYFAPKDKALELEDKLRSNGVSVLMVSKSGKAVLKDVITGD